MRLVIAAMGLAFSVAVTAGCQPPRSFGESGAEVYASVCATCHAPDGAGVNEAFPPLAGSPWVDLPDPYLIRLTLRGLRGQIVVHDRTYNNVMPPHAFLSDDELAMVLTYVRESFGTPKPIAAGQVASERARYGEGPMWTIEALTRTPLD